MLIDQYELLSSAQDVVAAELSDNVLDIKASRLFGAGPRPLYVVVQVTTVFADSGNNSNMTVYVQTDDNSGMNSATNMQTIGVFATNSAVGTQLIAPLISNVANERYLALYYDIGGGNLTTGAVTAFITPDPQAWTPLAVGHTGPTV